MDKDKDERSNKRGASLELGGVEVAQLEMDGEIGIDDGNGRIRAVEELSDEKKALKATAEAQKEEFISKFQDKETSSTTLTPVSVFPEEVWELILRKLEDSNEVLNVFKAYPYLEGLVLKNKYWWLFDQVVPHLRPWLNNEELMSCRLVCKKWAHGVDNHLENLPFRKVEHDHPITGQVWYPEGSCAHDHHKLGASHNRGCEVSFKRALQLTKFLRDVDRHPPARNPFPGRSVEFNMLERGENKVVYLNTALEILRKCGRHVWFLNIVYSGGNFCQLVLDVISLVPNLKGLHLYWWWWPGGDVLLDIFHDEQMALFPRLPLLESLEIKLMEEYCPAPPNFMEFFVHCYATQIQRLCITEEEWREEYATLFPKLREMELYGVHHPYHITDLFSSLDVPLLSRLGVCLLPNEDGSGYFKLTEIDIVSWVRPFPSLEHFDLFMHGSALFDVEIPLINTVSSIKSLSISCTDFHYFGPEFLPVFPSLEYVNVCSREGSVTFEDFKRPKYVYDWKIWEDLKSLKEINIRPGGELATPEGESVSPEDLPSHYNRATYEWVKKVRKERAKRQCSLSDDELQDCIEGFDSMISVTWGNEQGASAEGKDSQVDFDGENGQMVDE